MDVTGVAERVGKVVTHFRAHGEQQPSGLLGEVGRQLRIGATHHVSIADWLHCFFMRTALVLAIGAVLGLSGCSEPAADPLTGTSWQLVSIESMAPDEQPSLEIGDPAAYTVSFGDGGRATFQVDCNRGSASWTVQSAAPDSGSLTFGPVALTKMMCPQPSSDTQVAAALGRVRSYLLSDGRLHLSLEADSGIMHWQPAPSD